MARSSRLVRILVEIALAHLFFTTTIVAALSCSVWVASATSFDTGWCVAIATGAPAFVVFPVVSAMAFRLLLRQWRLRPDDRSIADVPTFYYLFLLGFAIVAININGFGFMHRQMLLQNAVVAEYDTVTSLVVDLPKIEENSQPVIIALPRARQLDEPTGQASRRQRQGYSSSGAWRVWPIVIDSDRDRRLWRAEFSGLSSPPPACTHFMVSNDIERARGLEAVEMALGVDEPPDPTVILDGVASPAGEAAKLNWLLKAALWWNAIPQAAALLGLVLDRLSQATRRKPS
ncbi:MAG: hypothetical protein QGG36_17170 [Pirellulaceae bacterium]|nr:hypothetical protein [Pirellulaceae bacterium]